MNQIEETGDQAPRFGEASVDRTLVLFLHTSMGNWKGKVTVRKRQELRHDERFF